MEEKIFSRKRLLIPKIKVVKKRKKSNISFNKNNDFNEQYSKSLKKMVKIFIIVVIAIFIANRIISIIEPTIDTLSIDMAKGIATQISNEQASVVMANYKYDDLSEIIRDENGKIRMIKMNVMLVNEITSDVAIKIQQEIENCDKSRFYIRLGTFTGSKILTGRGPNVEIKMSTTGNVKTDLVSEFSQAGVNQTLHRIYLNVECSISVLTPFDTKEETITNQVLLAEAVIVGDVPQNYYNLNGLSNDDLMQVIE